MKNGRKMLSLALAGAATTVVLSATPASAASYTMLCSVTGASGAMTVNGWGSGVTDLPLILALTDTKADGHHVQIRVVGKNEGGALITWPWHSNYDGNGTEKVWNSTASYSQGIYDIGVQIGVYEGDNLVGSTCTDWLRSDES